LKRISVQNGVLSQGPSLYHFVINLLQLTSTGREEDHWNLEGFINKLRSSGCVRQAGIHEDQGPDRKTQKPLLTLGRTR
jgi:hypothetical protein